MFRLGPCLVLVFVVSVIESAKNDSKAASVKNIPLRDILRDLKDLSKPKKGDVTESKPELRRTLVGLKKHKNYEIVLYEYSDEDDIQLGKNKEKDFDTELPEKETRSRAEKKKSRKQQTSESTTAASEDDDSKEKRPSNKNKNSSEENSPQDQTEAKRKLHYIRNKSRTSKKGSKAADYLGEDVTSENNSGEEEDTPFVWGQRERQNSQTTTSSGKKSKISSRGRETSDEEDDDHDIYSTNQKSTTKGKTTPSSGTTRKPIIQGQRQSLEDAPGAGRFIPRKRPRLPPIVEFTNTSTSEDELESDYEGDYSDDDEDSEENVQTCKDPTGKTGICEEYFKCSVLYSTNAQRINLQDYKCRLGKEIGICCPLFEEQDARGQPGRKLMKISDNKKVLSRQIKKLVRSNVNNSIIFGSDSIAQLDEIEQDLFTRGGQVISGSPAFGHNRFFPSSKKIRQVSEFGFELLQTTNDLSERLQLTNEISGLGLKSIKSSNTRLINDRCPRPVQCGINKYRLIDGSCNNLRRQKMGQSLTPLSRVLEPAYADGRWEPRISVRGFLLPSARLLSQKFIQDRENPNDDFTLFVMQFGQFIDHDVSSVPIFTFENGTGISCCRNGNFLPLPDRHPNCMPIEIPADDPFYGRFGQRCMNFVRSRMAPRIDCSLGYADQMNAVTHWLDLSNVYGSSDGEMRDLRIFEGGLLQFSELADRRMLLPLKRTTNGAIDYKAGDDRVNEMQGLMVMHLIWLREHNRVAVELKKINPFWTDEQLFQEARRIVIAEYQHIIYNEWLPIVVGREYMQSYGILPLSRKKVFKGYDPEIDASIENSFSAAGFRMGHTLVQGIVRLINEFGQANEAVTISNHADNALRTRAPNQIDKWIRGLAQQPIQSFDPFVTQHLNGRLFQSRGGFFGMDLSALNIQRARDHGVPGYNAFRELCQSGKRARSFDDFKDWIAPEIVDEMRRIYDHPDDVDLWIGGISEAPLKGALIGPTFTCIVGDQFARTKKGDRYFYDIGDQTHSFSPDQLQELRKASMARILCDNGDELEAVQPSVFLLPDFDFNSLVDCRRSRRIPRLNLRLWENEPTP